MVTQPKLLLIGENEDYLYALSEKLTSQSYAVKVANDGRVAVAATEEINPDLIILDLDFTRAMDEGFKTCMILRAITDCPMIVLSENDDELEKIKYLNLCADRFIEKPCDDRLLFAIVRSVIRLWFHHNGP